MLPKKLFFLSLNLFAQGKVGINTTTPAAMLHVMDSSVVFTADNISTFTPPPVSGAGSRMMWYPQKAAFRTGYVSGQQWNMDSIGIYSFASGYDTKASGDYSFAMGSLAQSNAPLSFALGATVKATGTQSIALGSLLVSSGFGSTAIGNNNISSGSVSTAIGGTTKAIGNFSTSTGFNTIAKSHNSFVVGRFNDTTSTSSISFIPTDPLFIIANGTSNSDRRNAMTVLKNGKTGINTHMPTAMLHVKDSSVVFTGLSPLPNTPGSPPVNGPGTRMMWYPDKAAFRAGVALGQQWNKDSIGLYSLAIGNDTRAFGHNSVAIGNLIKADGDFSVALGVNNITSGAQSTAIGSFLTASGMWSSAMGVSNTSTGNASTAIGNGTRASGWNSTSTGLQTVSNSVGMFAVGAYNDTIAAINPFTWFSNDQLFVIGNGVGGIRSNAITVLKSGKTGIGTITPQNKLHVSAGLSGATATSTAVGIFEDNTDVSINLITPNSEESAIYFGNPSNALHGGIVYNANVANGLAFRTNGNTTRAVINDVGNFGIGTTSPQKLLHVSEGPGGNLYNSAAEVIIEDDGASYLQFSSPTAFESGILSGNSVTSLRSALIFRADSSIQLRAGGGTTRLAVLKSGNIGIGTLTPQKLLHISDGAGGGNYFSNAELIIEDNDAAYQQFSTPSNEESGILSGNAVTSIRSALIFRPDSSVQIRTGGNLTKLALLKNGNVGIGDNSPNARLHISNGVGGGLYNAEADVIIEDNSDAYIQFSTPINEEAGIFSGHSSLEIRSAIRFKSDSSVVVSAGGTTERLSILKNGNTGIATTTPEAKLDVNGTAIIGTNGTILTEVIKVTVMHDIIPMLAGGSALETFAVPNATIGSSVMISPGTALQSGIIIAYARVSAAGTVEARFINTTAGAINPPPMDFYITVIK